MTKKETKFKKIGTGQMPIDMAALERMRKPGYHQINRGLTLDATPTEKAKYEIQQNILGYVQDNNISDQELKKRLECLLFAHIDNFSLDELFAYAEKLTEKQRIQEILQLANKEVREIQKTKKFSKDNSIEITCSREDILKTMKKK